MKSGALWVHCWGLARADFGRDPRSTTVWEAAEILFFWSCKRRTISPISARQHLTKFEQNNVDRCPDANFATSSRHNSATITYRPKLTTKIALNWTSSFLFTVKINSNQGNDQVTARPSYKITRNWDIVGGVDRALATDAGDCGL